MYHLGHTKAGPPIPLTQGMNNISCYPPPPHPRTRKLISSPFFSHEVNWRSLIKAAVFSWKLGSRYSSAQIPHTRFFFNPSLRLFFVPHHHFPLNFTVIYQVGLGKTHTHHAVHPCQVQAIVLSIFLSKVS